MGNIHRKTVQAGRGVHQHVLATVFTVGEQGFFHIAIESAEQVDFVLNQLQRRIVRTEFHRTKLAFKTNKAVAMLHMVFITTVFGIRVNAQFYLVNGSNGVVNHL